jgi:hypothetical protein
MLALHLLQSSLVRINTLLLQEVLKEPQWADRLTAPPPDGRGRTPPHKAHRPTTEPAQTDTPH